MTGRIADCAGPPNDDLAKMGPRDTVIDFWQGCQPRALEAVLSFARTTWASILALSDRVSLPTIRRFATNVLFCPVSGYGLVRVSTMLVSALRPLAIAYAERASEKASRRSLRIGSINEEVGPPD